jgi:hypothetical protein
MTRSSRAAVCGVTSQPSDLDFMKYLTALILAFVLAAVAHATPPSPQSFAQLLKLLNTQETLDTLARKYDAQLEDIFDRALTNRETPEGVAYGAVFRVKAQRHFDEEITLAYLAETYLKDTGAEWTQEEVDALIALGEKPTGRSALAKLAGTSQVVEKLALQRFARFRLEPNQSIQTAMKELKEINTKALAAQKAQAAVADPGTPEAKPAESTAAPAAPPSPPAETPKSK